MTNITSRQQMPKSNDTQTKPNRIRHYFILSLLSTICFCPITGLIALAFSLKSSAKKDAGYTERARLYSRWALIWNIVSLSIFFFTLLIVTFLIHGFYSLLAALRARVVEIGTYNSTTV